MYPVSCGGGRGQDVEGAVNDSNALLDGASDLRAMHILDYTYEMLGEAERLGLISDAERGDVLSKGRSAAYSIALHYGREGPLTRARRCEDFVCRLDKGMQGEVEGQLRAVKDLDAREVRAAQLRKQYSPGSQPPLDGEKVST